jgi:hypothetical protein
MIASFLLVGRYHIPLMGLTVSLLGSSVPIYIDSDLTPGTIICLARVMGLEVT